MATLRLIDFGSSARALWPSSVPADEKHLAKARDWVRKLDANLGGTEIGAALELAYRSGHPEGRVPELLLITDGEVWNQEPVIEAAAHSGHRIFSVGVGSAVSEALVRQLAERTGGACELVSPREDMAERIVRHFQRIHQPRVGSLRIAWPGACLRQLPEQLSGVYAGDTLHLFAWLAEPPQGEVRLEVSGEEGQTLHRSLPLVPFAPVGEEDSDTLPRLAAQARLATLDEEQARELAVGYQLISPHTSLVLVHEREADQKAEGVPALRKVPQVLAAGWGGLGSVDADREHRVQYGIAYPSESMDDLDVPAFLRLALDYEPPQGLTAVLNHRYRARFGGTLDLYRLSELQGLGLDGRLIDDLRGLTGSAGGERLVVIAFLAALVGTATGKGLSWHVRRLIRRAAREAPIGAELQRAVGLLVKRYGL